MRKKKYIIILVGGILVFSGVVLLSVLAVPNKATVEIPADLTMITNPRASIPLKFSQKGQYAYQILDGKNKELLKSGQIVVENPSDLQYVSTVLYENEVRLIRVFGNNDLLLEKMVELSDVELGSLTSVEDRYLVSKNDEISITYEAVSPDINIAIYKAAESIPFSRTDNTIVFSAATMDPGYNFVNLKFLSNYDLSVNTFQLTVYLQDESYIYGASKVSGVKFRVKREGGWRSSFVPGSQQLENSDQLFELVENGKAVCFVSIAPAIGFSSEEEYNSFLSRVIDFNLNGEFFQLFFSGSEYRTIEECMTAFPKDVSKVN